jgi:HTH-type transcriptional regulator/antitoxin HipB
MRIRAVDDFGAVARQRRQDLGLSQAELAERAGVTRQWLVRFERGNSEVSLSKVFALLSELGLVVRADASGAGRTGASSPEPKFTVPKVDMPQLNTDILRQTLDGLSIAPAQEVLSLVGDAIKRMSPAPSSPEEPRDE